MWNSFPVALMAISFFSNSAFAQPQKRTVAVSAYKSTINSVSTSLEPVQEKDDGEVGTPSVVIIMSTVTVVPLPASTAAGVFPSSFASGSGLPSGIFYPGTASGSGYALPTGTFPGNKTGNRTHHHHSHSANSTKVSPTLSVPFFTLSNTDSVPLPTSTPTLVSANTTSEVSSSLQTFTTSISTAEPSTTFSAQPSSTISSAAPTATGDRNVPFLRGVNLGGWLVLEKWMDSDVFSGDFANAVDQWSFDSISGAEKVLNKHWSTFFTESDIQTLASAGINALRIPIGYWAYNNTGTPYITGADAYLETAIGWARNAGMKVWVDCHGSPGSQNGFDNSGHAGNVNWQQRSNQDASIQVLQTMAQKYGAEEYADVVVGLELVNEPISYGNNNFDVTQQWAQQAYKAVKAKAANENLVIVMHDAFQGPLAWTEIAKDLHSGNVKTFGVDTHLYQLFVDSDNELTQAQHITEACGWASNLGTANAVMPTYVGEWSAATNICVNPDGSTTAGTSCSTKGCQCQSADFDDWNDNLIAETRKFVEAQLDVFEQSTSGYFMWAAKGPGGWGFLNGLEKGIIPNPVTSRKYSGQCGLLGRKRREVRGRLGISGEAW